MEGEKTLCVMCAWRAGCNKKFTMDGSTTTRCPEFTRDITLGGAKDEPPKQDDKSEPRT
jgi:hypothetical protein